MQDWFIHTPLHVSNFWKTKKSFHEIWTSIGHDFPKKIKSGSYFQVKLYIPFALCFEISKQTTKLLCSLL